MARTEHAAEDWRSSRIWGASLGERVSQYAKRVGLQDSGKLADTANELLGGGYDPVSGKRRRGIASMNRELVRSLKRDSIGPGNGIDELQLAAIARAVGIPMEWLDVDPNAPAVQFMRTLIGGHAAPTNGGEEASVTQLRRSTDQVELDKRWIHESAAQAA